MEYGSSELTGKSYREISKATCTRLRTVISVCGQYLKHGCVLLKKKHENRIWNKKLSDSQRKWVTSPHTLKQMVSYSLLKRCRLI